MFIVEKHETKTAVSINSSTTESTNCKTNDTTKEPETTTETTTQHMKTTWEATISLNEVVTSTIQVRKQSKAAKKQQIYILIYLKE